MLVHAFIASVGTGPEPAVFTILNRILEMVAYFVRGGFRIAMFAEDDLS